MLKGIISITGKSGLFRLLSRGKNALIVENLATGKRIPTYPTDKVISLADISMYSDGGDVPLAEVLESLKSVAEGQAVNVKAMSDDEVRELFAKVLPDFDRERVYNSDIKKLYNWYNQLIASGITEFKESAEETAEAPAEESENA